MNLLDWEKQRKRGWGHLFRKVTLPPWRVWRRATAFARALPDFIIIGAQKGGTTSLYEYLVRHPQVRAAMKKEIRYFGENYSQGLIWYRSHFPLAYKLDKRKFLTGESSPTTLFHPLAPERVAQTIPAVKLIVLLRDPVQRAFSHYQMNLRSGRDHLSFEEALGREAERLDGAVEGVIEGEDEAVYRYTSFSYMARGEYAAQLERWYEVFSKEQMLILQSEELFQNPANVFRKTLNFLQLPEVELPKYHAHNPGRYDREMPEHSRQFLAVHFREPNQRLYTLLDQDFGWQREIKMAEAT